MNKKIPQILLTFVILLGMFSFSTNALTEPQPITKSQVLDNIQALAKILEINDGNLNNGTGVYFTTYGNKSCGNSSCVECNNYYVMQSKWLTYKIDCAVDISQVPGHAYPKGSYGYPRGSSCHGFANFAQWYIFKSSNSDIVKNTRIADNIYLTKEHLKDIVMPGDIIRYTYNLTEGWGHSVIVISVEDTGIKVLDANFRENTYQHNITRIHTVNYNSNYPCAVSRATNYDVTDDVPPVENEQPTNKPICQKTQYRYYHYTNGEGKYSVCAYYGKTNGGWSKAYREDTGWLDSPLTKVADNFRHVVVSGCAAAGCTDPSWSGGSKYTAPSGVVWYKEETRTVEGHDYVPSTTKVVTCTTDGVITYTCSGCSDSYTETVPAIGKHNFDDWEVVTPAEEGKAGLQKRICFACGDTEYEDIPALPVVETVTERNIKITMTINQTKATVSGKVVRTDVPPIIVGSRTMLPARFIAENLEAEVYWDADERMVTIVDDDVEIVMYIDEEYAYVNGKSVLLDAPPFIENGRTYTPVRFIAEALGATVEWKSKTEKVIITKTIIE